MKNLTDVFKFVLSFAIHDIKTRYAGSYLGVLWAFVQPIITILVFWFVFQIGFRATPIEGAPFIIWFICGIIPWFFISEAILSGANCIIEYGYIVKKVIFKVDLLPLIKICSSAFIHFAFLSILLIISYVYLNNNLDMHVLQIFYYTACAILLCLGTSYCFAAVIPFARDLSQFISIVMQFGFWVTPICWNYIVIPTNYHWFFKFNPAFYIVQGYRDSVVYNIWFWERPLETVIFFSFIIVLFLVGIILFNKLKPYFSEVL